MLCRKQLRSVAVVLLLALLLPVSPIQSQQVAEQCDLPGYIFKSGQRPVGASVVFLSSQPQASSRTAALAACNADPVCTMFTTDGWLLGTTAYFTSKQMGATSGNQVLTRGDKLSSDHFDISWSQPYCGECRDAPDCCGSTAFTGKCCGTYVAAVSADAGQLAPQPASTRAVSSEFTAKTCPDQTSANCRLRYSVVARDAPCTGAGKDAIVMYPCHFGAPSGCTSRKCTVPVLGAPLDHTASRAVIESEDQAVKVDPLRCATLTSQDVRKSGHPGCCQKCWSTCCDAMSRHIQHYLNYTIKPWDQRGFPRGVNLSLNFPSNGRCLAEDVAVSGSCCQQLSYMREYLPLSSSALLSYIPLCTLECAKKCGFVHVASAGRNEKQLWCVLPMVAYAPVGPYPLWMVQQYLVKKSVSADAGGDTAAMAATSKQRCSLC
jgi:hypothetical protein